MDEPAGGISAQTVVSGGPEALLTTKLYLPRPASGFVGRSRLIEKLDEGLARAVTLVSAPAGFGKTSVLADWSQQHASRVAWLSLDEGDNDPVRFWRYIVAALDRLRPGLSARVSLLLRSPPSGSFDGVVTQLINELAAEPDDLVLVLDDYHVIDTESVHQSLSFLVEHAPAGIHVVLATRADPPLSLARIRAQGQLAEVRAAELRFTPSEAAGLLRETVGSSLRDEAVATLTARTEGWAAGLHLAGLSLRDQSDVAGFVETFSGSHRYVLDYLTEEVLEHQPEPVRQFLLETSVLERLSGPLCDAVTGRSDSQAMLESMERSNLFLVPLDDVRVWWRNHQLFADLLRVRLQEQEPGRVLELHRNAARWHEEHGLVDDAVRHAAAAGDAMWAARLVERHADALLTGGEGTTLHRWLTALPQGLVISRPRLLLARTRFVQLVEVEALLDAAEAAFADTALEPFEPSVGRGASRLANVPAMIAVGRAFVAFQRGDGEATLSFASHALAAVRVGEWFLESLATADLGAAKWLCGRLPEAEGAIAASIAQWLDGGMHEMVALWCQYLGQIQCALGRPDRALGTFQRTLDDLGALGQSASLAAGSAYVGMAVAAYERGDLEVASRHLDEGLLLCRQFVNPDALANGLALLAWIRQAEGDAPGAMDAMAEAESAADPSMTDLLNAVPAQRARLLIAEGDIAAAAEWTAQRGLGSEDEPTYPGELAHLVLARVLVAQAHTGAALRLLERLHASAQAEGRVGSVIEIQGLRALAHWADADQAAAVAAVTDALALGQVHGHVRVFVDEGAPMAALLGTFLASRLREPTTSVSLGYLGTLVRAFEYEARGRVTPGRGAGPGLVTPLSERELDVLRLLAAGEQNQEIADELYVSLNTVKKHVTHIFEKLGAANRTEAASRARELGLLS